MYNSEQRTALFGEQPTRRTNLFAQSSSANSSSSTLHQQKFGSANLGSSSLKPQGQNIPQFRTPSPYEKDSAKKQGAYNQSLMSSLESQNNEELDSIHHKVSLLKDLGVSMGSEIRNSSKTMESLNDTFGLAGTKVKLTYNRMIVMSRNAGISWQIWFMFFFAVFLFFFWVWIT